MTVEISIATAAAMAKVSAKTIREWIRLDGLPTVREGNKGPGQGARLDAIAFVRWYIDRVTTPAGSLDLEQERARLAKWQADKTQQAVELQAGKTMLADDVMDWTASMIHTAKARLVLIPDAVAQVMPHEHSQFAASEVRRLIYEALAELSARGSPGGRV